MGLCVRGISDHWSSVKVRAIMGDWGEFLALNGAADAGGV